MSVADVTALFPALSISSKSDEKTFLKTLVKDVNFIDFTNEYHYLNDPDTIAFIKESKVIFINRGLPGSGKSTLTKKIKELYGVESTLACSADDFFTDKDGNYSWNGDQLGEAHFTCHNKAENGCMSSVTPIVIDNTNVKFFEVKRYLDLANKYNYIVVLTEPKTPWKFDPNELFKRNTHKVPLDVIKNKCQQFEVMVPYYFSWTLSQNDAKYLIDQAKDVLATCFYQIPKYKEDFKSKHADLDSPFKVFRFKKAELHCTTKYIGGKKISNTAENVSYYTNQNVAENMGRAFQLKVVGFCITESTVSAMISLVGETQKFLWKNNITEKERTAIVSDPFYKNQPDINSLFGQLEHGAHAHITLALAPEIRAKQAVADSVHIKLRLLISKQGGIPIEKITLDNYQILYANDLYCLIKLKQPIFVNSLFTGFY